MRKPIGTVLTVLTLVAWGATGWAAENEPAASREDYPMSSLETMYRQLKAPLHGVDGIAELKQILQDAQAVVDAHPDAPKDGNNVEIFNRRVRMPAARRLFEQEPTPENRQQLEAILGTVCSSPRMNGHLMDKERSEAEALRAELMFWDDQGNLTVPRERVAKHIAELMATYTAGDLAQTYGGTIRLCAARLAGRANLAELRTRLCDELAREYLSASGVAEYLVKTGHAPIVKGELRTLDGKTIRLPDDTAGKVVVIDFWATWCAPCLRSMPHFKDVWQQYKDQDVLFIGEACDTAKENGKASPEKAREHVKAFLADKEYGWTHCASGSFSPVGVAYGLRGIPHVMVIGRDGRIATWQARGHEVEAIQKALGISAATTSSPTRAQAANQDGTGFAGAYAPSKRWQPPRDPLALKKLNQFQDLKFGFFYCWGTQTQWETIDQSWSLCPERYPWNKRPGVHADDDTLTYKKAYEELIKTFHPVKFDPQAVADLAEEAGTRYLVFCTKHHDGFCFWDTKTTEYKITSKDCPYHTAPNADVTRALFDAFRKKDFWIGAYFSKPDWNVPTYWAPQFGAPTSRNANYKPGKYPDVWKKFKEFTWAQIRELMSGYGPVDILWLDGGQVQPRNGQNIDMPGMAGMARKLQPGLLVVDRTAGGGYEDFLTPEGTHAMPKSYRPEVWEACMTLGERWGWTKDSSYHSAGTIIRYLVRAVARNGNLLLDVGPDAQGELDPEAVRILKEIGAWLKVNGEAIYGTRPVKPYESGNCFFTQKADGTLYAIVLSEKDGDGLPRSVTLPAAVAGDARSITLVGSAGAPLTFRVEANGTAVVELPATAIAQPPCAHAWAFKISQLPSTGDR